MQFNLTFSIHPEAIFGTWILSCAQRITAHMKYYFLVIQLSILSNKNQYSRNTTWTYLYILCNYRFCVREHPFNLKGGGGAMVFFQKIFVLSANLIGKKIPSLKWAEKIYSVGTLGLKICCFCRKKIMLRQHVMKKKFCCTGKRIKKIFWLRKKP